MQTSYVSTLSMRSASQADLARLQRELRDFTIEAATSRHADVGLALGTQAGRPVDARIERDLLSTLLISNASALARLEQTQVALSDVESVASETLAAATALPPGRQSAITVRLQAETALDRLADRMNASDGGSYIFGGTNAQEVPFTRFDDGPRAAVQAAFLARFGIAVGDPASATIPAADIADFIDNEFAALFADPAWGTTWSAASSTDWVSRIAPSERALTGTNANEQAIRTTAMGLAMIAGLGFETLSQDARDVIEENARVTLGEGITEILQVKARLGFSENAIAKATDRMEVAVDLMSQAIVRDEGADPVEAKVQVDLLTTQIEISYAMTNQLARLNILNYA